MSDTSRRKFLAAAGVGAAASATALGTGSASARPSATRAKEPVLALVEDPARGTIRFLVGEREVVVDDRDLATRLLNAAGGK